MKNSMIRKFGNGKIQNYENMEIRKFDNSKTQKYENSIIQKFKNTKIKKKTKKIKLFYILQFIVLAALVAVALAAPQGQQPQVVLVKETPSDNIGLDGYNFAYELSNGETRRESAQLRNAGSENEAIVVSGSFSWVDEKSGLKYTVTYTADENGFHPVGDHIPA